MENLVLWQTPAGAGLVIIYLWGYVSCNLNIMLHKLESLGIKDIYGNHKMCDDTIRCNIHSIACGKYIVIKILNFQVLPPTFLIKTVL